MESRNERRGNLLELLVIRATASRMNETAGDTRDQQLIRDDKFNNTVKLFFATGQHGVKFLCLRDCSWETVKNKPNIKSQYLRSSQGLLKYERSASRSRSACIETYDVVKHADCTYPFLQALLFCSWSLMIPTMISSLTRPPASMIFFASTPRGVLAATCSRNKSPVAKWQMQYSSLILGACVPLPKAQS